MRDAVNADQIDRYREQGFVVIENALDPNEVAELAAAVARGVAALGDNILAGGDDWKASEGFYGKVFVQRINLWKIEPTVKRYMLGTGIGDMAETLAGVPLRCWHDQTLQKQPWANPTGWHLDVPYWSFTSRDAISAWIALDDVTVQNGCLYFLPGSHRLVRFDNVGIGPNMADLFRVYPELANIEPVPVPMRPGSISFHNGLTAHAAGPNMTPRWRRAMTCGYMPAGATFNGQKNILSDERLARLAVGDSLDDDAENPRVGAGGEGVREQPKTKAK